MCGRGLYREIHLSVRKSLSGEMHASEVRFGKREVDIPARSSESCFLSALLKLHGETNRVLGQGLGIFGIENGPPTNAHVWRSS